MRRLHRRIPSMARNPQLDDRLDDYTADARLITLSVMAALVGVISAFVALALVRLIGQFTNLAYFHRLSTSFASPAASPLGAWRALIPVGGGLIVGLMARVRRTQPAWWVTSSAPPFSAHGSSSRATSTLERKAGSRGCAARRPSGCPPPPPARRRSAGAAGTSSSCRAGCA